MFVRLLIRMHVRQEQRVEIPTLLVADPNGLAKRTFFCFLYTDQQILLLYQPKCCILRCHIARRANFFCVVLRKKKKMANAGTNQWYSQAAGGVVRVESYTTPFDWSRPDISSKQKPGVGTGFFVPLNKELTATGWMAILTCSHVLMGSLRDQISIVFPKVGRQRWQTAFVHALCPTYDLGIVAFKIPAGNSEITNAIQPLPLLKNQTTSLVGEQVSAFGYPLGQPSLKYTSGEYSGLENGFIQHNADINPGNSGGPLILARTGQVIGVNALAMLFTSGVHYAVPIQLYSRLAHQLLSSAEPKVVVPPSLGFCYHAATEAMLSKNKVNLAGGAEPGGVYVYHLFQNSPLRKAGLKRGDIITRVKLPGREWQPLDRFGDLKTDWNGEQRVPIQHVLARMDVNDAVGLEFSQNGVTKQVETKQIPLTPGSLRMMAPPFGKKPDYLLFGGLCVMSLRANHAGLFPQLFAAMNTRCMEVEVLVVSAVMPGYTQAIPLKAGDFIEIVNGQGAEGKALDPDFEGERVNTVQKYRDALMMHQNGYITIASTKGHVYVLSTKQALERERALAQVYQTDAQIMAWLEKVA